MSRERDEALFYPAPLLSLKRCLAREMLWFAETDETVEPAFEQCVIGGQIALPRPIALFDAQGIQREHAKGAQAMALACPAHRVPDRFGIGGL